MEKTVSSSRSIVDLGFTAPYLVIGLELILATLIGFALIALGVGGGAWILSGIAAGALVFYGYRSRFNSQAKPNRDARKIGQILVGISIGFSIKFSYLSDLYWQLPILVLLTAFLLFCSGIIGYLYSRLQKTDLLTALLATIPGNIGVMASIAADYERNISLVSLVQLIRFTAVILLVPLIANVTHDHDVNAVINSLADSFLSYDITSFLLLSLLLSITLSIVHLGTKFKIPVAALFGSIIASLLFNFTLDYVPLTPGINFHLPPIFSLIGQILLGLTIGEYWAINSKLNKRTITYAWMPVLLTFLAGLISAGIAMFITHWDWLTCLLVTSPGGSPEMILIALTLNRNVEIVTIGHLIRLIAINLLLPLVISSVSLGRQEATSNRQQVTGNII